MTAVLRVRLKRRMKPLAGPALEAGSVLWAEHVNGELLRASRGVRSSFAGGAVGCYLVLAADDWEPVMEDEDLAGLLSA